MEWLRLAKPSKIFQRCSRDSLSKREPGLKSWGTQCSMKSESMAPSWPSYQLFCSNISAIFFWRLKIVQDHSIYAFGWIQILRRWNIVSKVSNNSGGVRWFMIWKLRSNSFVFVHVRIIWNLWMSLEWLSIFDQLRGQMATLKIAYGPSVMLRQGGHGCQQPTVTQSALPRCGWWWRLRP